MGIRSDSNSRGASCRLQRSAASFCLRSALMRLDLPTFERPTMAISGMPVWRNCDGSAADVTKRASVRFTLRRHEPPHRTPYSGSDTSRRRRRDQRRRRCTQRAMAPIHRRPRRRHHAGCTHFPHLCVQLCPRGAGTLEVFFAVFDNQQLRPMMFQSSQRGPFVSLDIEQHEPDAAGTEGVHDGCREGDWRFDPGPESSRLAAPWFPESAHGICISAGSAPNAADSNRTVPATPLRSIFRRARSRAAGCGSTPMTRPRSPTARAATMTCRPLFTPARRALSDGRKFRETNSRVSGSYVPWR